MKAFSNFKIIALTVLFSLAFVTANAQNTKTKFKTNGIKPKATIEAAAKNVDGVRSASYDEDDKELTIEYDKAKTTPEKVRKAVLKVDRKQTTSSKTSAKKKTSKKKTQKNNSSKKTKKAKIKDAPDGVTLSNSSR